MCAIALWTRFLAAPNATPFLKYDQRTTLPGRLSSLEHAQICDLLPPLRNPGGFKKRDNNA